MKRVAKTTAMLVLVAGCASIVSGTSQQITIDSNPKGANCSLTREGQAIGSVLTPSGLVIKKSKHDIAIACAKTGYQRATATLTSDVESATFGNLLIGGAVGWAIDSATGADNKYDDVITVTLVPDVGTGGAAPAESKITTSMAEKPRPGSMGSSKANEPEAAMPAAEKSTGAPKPSTTVARAPSPAPGSMSSAKAAIADPPKPVAPTPRPVVTAPTAPVPTSPPVTTRAPAVQGGTWHTVDDRVRMHVSPSDAAPGIAMPRAVPLTMLTRASDWGLFRYATAEGGHAQGWILIASVESAG
ncbi:MAG: hypothetical protein O3A96_02030 [Proteobacteria bacterium]|nr:hypothetical protein [Pseudomonadota bacterium]